MTAEHRALPTNEVPSPDNSLAARVRQLRKDRGLTQMQLAAAAGMVQPQISAIELGEIKTPSEDALVRIAEALDVPPSDLYERSRFEGTVVMDQTLRNRLRRMTVPEQRIASHILAYFTRDIDIESANSEEQQAIRLLVEFWKQRLES